MSLSTLNQYWESYLQQLDKKPVQTKVSCTTVNAERTTLPADNQPTAPTTDDRKRHQGEHSLTSLE